MSTRELSGAVSGRMRSLIDGEVQINGVELVSRCTIPQRSSFMPSGMPLQ